MRYCIANHFLCSCVCDMNHESAIKNFYYYYYNISSNEIIVKSSKQTKIENIFYHQWIAHTPEKLPLH